MKLNQERPFPTEAVCQLMNLKVPTSGDTYLSMDFTYDQLLTLIELGAADPLDQQNNAPPIYEFVDFFKPYANEVSFEGYIIFPPRSDARVSIEGFNFSAADEAERLKVINRFHDADEFDADTRSIRAWWD